MVPAFPGSEERLARCHRNYIESLWQYVRSLPGAERRDLPGGTLIRSHVPVGLANTAFLLDSGGPLGAFLAESSEFFGSRIPWRLLVPGPAPERLGPLVRRLRLEPAQNEPGMILDPIPPSPQRPSALTIRPVVDRDTFSDFGTVWCEAFGLPAWTLPVALPRVPPDDPVRGAQNRFFVGYDGTKPVSCSTLTVTERVAGIASVGTVRRARGRGFGAAITWGAVESGAALGADVGYLAASRLGFPVYERMGFRRASEYPSWQVPLGFFRMIRAIRTLRRLAREAGSLASQPNGLVPSP